MIIDGHAHVGNMPGFRIEIHEVMRVADQAGFDKLVCMHFGALFHDMREGNRQLGEAMNRYADRLLGYATITSAYYGQIAVGEIERCYELYGMKAIKVIHRVGGLGSYGIVTSINQPAMYPIFEKAAELGLPILAHATPEECEALAQRFPEVPLIMAHMGGCPTALGDWHKAIEAAKRHASIYLDTASSQADMGYIETAVEAIGAERVIFGTDVPLLDPFAQLAKITGTELSLEEKRLILGANIARLLRLDC